MTQDGPDSALARGGNPPMNSERDREGEGGPISGIYYLKAKKPHTGHFQACSIQTEKPSGKTY